MLEVKLYNSYTNKKEVFKPENPNSVKIYSCGPTVYNFNHIGNFRSYIFTDVLRRSLKLLGYQLDQTMNITDIDDKIINESIKLGVTVEEFTKKWIQIFFEDLATLNIEKLEHYPKATESVPEMIDLIDSLKEKKLIYEKEGSIYYSLAGFKNYGKLSKIDIDGMKTGARYDADEYTKDDVRDFVLWKSPKLEGEKFWETKYGNGRPGWHLECSAMIRKIYSSGIDIHTGGIDLLFPHHENEIAQSMGAYPDEHFVNLWMHCEHLLVDNQKMSKSLGNYYTLRDLISKGYDPKAIRYLLLSAHYRTKLNFSLKSLEEASKAIAKIQNTLTRILEKLNYDLSLSKQTGYSKKQLEEFLESIADDLNTSKAVGTIFDFIKTINASLDSNSLSKEDAGDTLFYFQKINDLLGILNFEKPKEENLDSEIQALIDKRQEAKKNKDFALADSIRKELLDKGIILEDSPTGVKWKRK
ncbi:MAG TPA: cysteine--tRNA ligase [Leptospiraceae bacterium]|nr:cysteine--tRNA ligase [Leptospiraceae bacterium]HMW07825.1 cysteine--tRNA ligase [Leptospiraceae bacterium]HMX34619.1 cysteine--tRNA ligase [Leptospiraceae bacterium]HMY33489.1 cysteine--tRNA ligase [Leptospiraceae bacterium]HMZ65643.1 cysteine--tRNA ligase [Leptospiraceae bacterium]